MTLVIVPPAVPSPVTTEGERPCLLGVVYTRVPLGPPFRATVEATLGLLTEGTAVRAGDRPTADRPGDLLTAK